MSIKQKFRFIFWGSISIASYVFSLILLFQNQDLLRSFIPIFVFFISFHFFYLELATLNQKYVLWAMIVGIAATGFLMTDHSVVIWIANIAFHATIWKLSHSLYRETEGTIGFAGFAYFSSGGYLFTLMLSLVYSIFVIHLFAQFPLDCRQLDEKTDQIIAFVAKPLKLTRDKTQDISSGVKNLLSAPVNSLSLFFNPEVDQILGGRASGGGISNTDTLSQILEQFGIQSPQGDQQDMNLQNLLSSVMDKVGIQEEVEETTKPVDEKHQKLSNTIISLKQNLVAPTIQDNEKINSTICEVTLSTINQKMQSPSIKYSVTFTMLLLIYPFLRIIIWVMSLLGLFIFEICYLVGIYRKRTETRVVDRIG